MSQRHVVTKALELKRSGSYQKSINILEQEKLLTNNNSELESINNSLGKLYLITGEYEKAKHIFLNLADIVIEMSNEIPPQGIKMGDGMEISKKQAIGLNANFIRNYANHIGAALLNDRLDDFSGYLFSIGKRDQPSSEQVYQREEKHRILTGIATMELEMKFREHKVFGQMKEVILKALR